MSGWQVYVGDYDKRFYEVMLNSGATHKHLWPNKGDFHTTDGSGFVFDGGMVKMFRLCDCGHRLAGCTPDQVSEVRDG